MSYRMKRMRRLAAPLLLAVFIGAGLWQSALAQAEPVQPAAPQAPGVQTLILPATQDAYVNSQAPAANYASEPDLQILRIILSQAIVQRQVLVQFDLSSIPEGSTILNAELALFQTDGTNNQLLINRNLTEWKQDGVTWNTRPRTAPAGGWNPGTVAGEYVTTDLTALVDAWINSPANSPNFGVTLVSGATGGSDARIFHSSERDGGRPPQLRVQFQIPPIRICSDEVVSCKGVGGAELFDRTTGKRYTTDNNGYVTDDGAIQLGASLWARLQVEETRRFTRFCTTGAPVTVEAGAFTPDPVEMRIAMRCDRPLTLYNLELSAQWYLDDNPAQRDTLRRNIIRGSDFLYDFTEGQFALGQVTVRQSYEGWDAANIRLFANNTFRPNANVGGIVEVETPDPSATIPLSYTQGHVFMGSYWNRFGTPPNQVNKYKGQVVDPATLVDDWAIALAHELGHYLLFLFDTYTDKNGVSNEQIAAACTGSAMGNAFEPGNHAFISSQPFWASACGETEAFARLQGRNEWDTISAWHPWVSIPVATEPGVFPPIALTQVVFIAPAAIPPPLAASQLFTLEYQAGETTSGEARAFLIRGDTLVFDQGKPPRDATTVQLTDARLGDRLCLYDINDFAEAGGMPRHQFGCETIVAGDSLLVMTRNESWSPLIALEQTGDQQLKVTVTQPVGDAPVAAMQARLFAEDGAGFGSITLSGDGTNWQGVFELPAPVPPVYLQLWLDETVPAPETRREVMADRGVGGNGAYGPAKLYSGVMVVSSDGSATYHSDDPRFLEPGQSIAWQSMPGTPALPPRKQISGQSYRLDALPAALVEGGTVSIEFDDVFGAATQTAFAAAPSAAPAIFLWNGNTWTELPTTIGTPAAGVEGAAADGVRIASAPSQGVGVYAVLGEFAQSIYFPQVRR
jgi:hypothetical protein